MASPVEECPRGPWTALHEAASDGSSALVERMVSTGSIEINRGCPKGFTPLILAADGGYLRIVSMLLSRGAIVTAMGDGGVTALHVSSKNGHVAVSTMLLGAGADVGQSSPSSGGYTALHLAAQRGRCDVMELLIRAGANVDDRLTDGATAMYLAAERAQLLAVKILLANEAQPMIATEEGYTPLDVASHKRHVDIVRELIKSVGIEGCGGSSGGALALRLAAQSGHLATMHILHAAGVRDSSGLALCEAIIHGGETAVKFLIDCADEFVSTCPRLGTYVNSACGTVGKPMLCCLVKSGIRVLSHRVMRRLIDAGAQTTFTFNRLDDDGNFMYQTTFMEMVIILLHEKGSAGMSFTRKQMDGLRGMRNLLLQIDAVRAVSWGWTSNGDVRGSAAATSTPRALLPPMRRERAATKTRVVMRALRRYTGKMDEPFVGYAET